MDKGIVDADKCVRFQTVDVKLAQFCNIITASPWSPMVFEHGYRAKKFFKGVQLLSLDFDNGELTIDEAVDLMNQGDYTAIIGTTKSHQKKKVLKSGTVLPECDRFRLIVPLEAPIVDVGTYHLAIKNVMAMLPCDPSCKDVARFYYPCSEIVSVHSGHRRWPLPTDDDIAMMRLEEEMVLEKSKERIKAYKDGKMGLPPKILAVLEHGAPQGEQHNTLYRTAAELAKFGWSEEEITEAFRATNIGGYGVMGKKEIDTIRDAMQAAFQGGWEL